MQSTSNKTHTQLRAEYRTCIAMAMSPARKTLPVRYWTNRAAKASAQLQALRES